MSGGGAATKYFIFEAKEPGTYQVRAKHYFRGELKNDYSIEVTVEEK